MKPSSAKAKGRRLQKEVAEVVLKRFPQLEPDDVRPAVMGESGTDLKLSPAAQMLWPFDTECKNQERLNIWAALEQARANTREGRIPLLVFKRNRSETYAALPLAALVDLLGGETR